MVINNLLTAIIVLLVGIAVFITGMNIMSSGLKKACGKGVKDLFKKTQNNSLAGLGIGASTTAIIQSSAATSVMVIGFINAGIMTAFQGISIILGAYIGTTVTGLLVSLSSFNISIYFMLLAFVGVIMMFLKNQKVKNIGEVLTGLGLLFFGLENMKGAFSFVDIHDFCVSLFSSIDFPILLMIIGAIVTALVQSSSATSGIVIVMVGQGAIPLSSGLYLVLGATIGTVITTILATIGGNANAKRTGLMCLIIRVITAFIALAIVWPINALNNDAVASLFLNVFQTPELAVAMFLVIYNVIFMCALLPFIRLIEKISFKLVKDKEEESVKKAIKYIDRHMLGSTTISLMQVKKEIENMISLAKRNYELGYQRIMTQNKDNDAEIEDTENKIDYINNQITNFLIELSHRASMEEEKIIGSYFHVVNDIERIGDHAYNFYESSTKMAENNLSFSMTAKKELEEMNQIVEEMFSLTNIIFDQMKKEDLMALHNLEEKTDKLKTSLSEAHFARIVANQCNNELSPFYSTFLSELERVADHLVNIGYSIVNPTGDEK